MIACLGGIALIGAAPFADLTVTGFPLDMTYTAQNSGTALSKHDGTSGLRNFLQETNIRGSFHDELNVMRAATHGGRENSRPHDCIPI